MYTFVEKQRRLPVMERAGRSIAVSVIGKRNNKDSYRQVFSIVAYGKAAIHILKGTPVVIDS